MQTFHNKCDNIKDTLTILKTTKGMRFGGYTEQIWNNNGNISKADYFKKDAKNICFCFSLDLFKNYNFNDNYKWPIDCYYNYGPCFHDGERSFFIIYNENGFLIGDTYYQTKHNSFGKFDIDYGINNGQINYSIVEF